MSEAGVLLAVDLGLCILSLLYLCWGRLVIPENGLFFRGLTAAGYGVFLISSLLLPFLLTWNVINLLTHFAG